MKKDILKTESFIRFFWVIALAVALVGFGPGASAFDVTDNLSISGYFAQRLSMNTSDMDGETLNYGDKGELSMIRATLYLQADYTNKISDFPYALTVIAELDKEWYDDYIDDLDATSGADLEDFYQRDTIRESTFREYYVDFDLGERIHVRLGKQQVAWGKTDYWQVMDVVNAYDWTWRHFLEVENEWTRKPAIMSNIIVKMPEANGKLQLLFRPGWEHDPDVIGNGYDIFGGRWASKPNKGISFPDDFGVPMNYDHPEGDHNEPDYGFRWESFLGQLEYSLAFYHGNARNPVVNPSSMIGGVPYHQEPANGKIAELIHPEVDLIGATGTYYIDFLDVVARTEVAYLFDNPFNYGSNFLGGALPGFAGIIEKDLLKWMVAFDKQVDFVKTLFGAYRPGFFNFQIYDEWIMDYENDDDIVFLAGYGSTLKEHSFKVTGWLNWNYDYDRITTGVSYAWDPTYDGVLLMPNINFAYGNHWRVRLEWSTWIVNDSKDAGEVENDTYLFGLFKNNDQLYLRIMYYF